MTKFVIKHMDNPDFYISGISLNNCATHHPVRWTMGEGDALYLEKEEAEATIKFIEDVIDYELAGSLAIKSVEFSDFD